MFIQKYFFLEDQQIEELEHGQRFDDVFSFNLHTDLVNERPIRSYLFR